MGHRALRWALGAVTVAVASTVVGTAPAFADVTMTPGQAVQGEAAKLTFRVTEDRTPAYTTKIELVMPESAPVAETYPMSVPDWAPRMTMRKVDQSLGGIHHGRVSEVVASITWTRAGAPRAGGGPAELVVSLGPMPQTDRMSFVLVQSYSDGHVTTWDQPSSTEGPRPEFPAPVLTLTPAGSAVPAGPEAGASGATGGQEPADTVAVPGDDADGQGLGSLAVGLVIGLLCGLAVAAWLYLRRYRSGTDDSASTPANRSDEADESASESGASTNEPTPSGTADAAPPSTAHGRSSTAGRAWRLRE